MSLGDALGGDSRRSAKRPQSRPAPLSSKNNALNVCVMTGAVSRILSAACARRYKGANSTYNDIGTISYAAHTAVISPPSHIATGGVRFFGGCCMVRTALTKSCFCARARGADKECAEEGKNSTHQNLLACFLYGSCGVFCTSAL
jgi:hypothetical protein